MKRLFWKLAAVGGGFYVFVGALLCMTIVAAPVGLALMIFGSLAMFGARNKRGFQKSQRPTVVRIAVLRPHPRHDSAVCAAGGDEQRLPQRAQRDREFSPF